MGIVLCGLIDRKAESVRNVSKLPTPAIARRAFLIGASAMTLAGCVSTRQTPQVAQPVSMPPPPPTPPMYYALPNERFPIPEVDVSKVDPKWWRTEVDYPTDERAGIVIVDTPNRYLYHV